MRRTKLSPISQKQKVELALRRWLKAKLMQEQLKAVGYIYCSTCGRRPDWRGITLSHIIALSRGGKTEPSNVILECFSCHSKRHGLEEGVIYVNAIR